MTGKKVSKMPTLYSFIDEQVENFGILTTPENQKKIYADIRAKFTRILKNSEPFKSSHTWDNAEIKVIGRARTRIFKSEDLQEVLKQAAPYLRKLQIKTAGFSVKQIEKEAKQKEQELEDDSQKEYDQYYGPETGEALTRSLNQLMLEALFNHFFEMTPEQKRIFAADRGTLYLPWGKQNSVAAVIAQKRLKNPEKYYYSIRNK